MLCHILPNLDKVLLVGVSLLDLVRTDTGRAHDDIQSFGDGIFRHRHKDLVQVLFEAVKVEILDVTLWDIDTGGDIVVTPVRIHVLADEGHLPSGIHDPVNDILVISKASVDIIVVPFGALLIEPGTECLGEAVKVDALPVGIH